MGQGADPNQETLAPLGSPPTPQPPRVHYLLDLFSRESEPTRHGGEREKARRARKGDERERDVEFGGGPGCQASSPIMPKLSSVGPHVSVSVSSLSLDGLRADKRDIWA